MGGRARLLSIEPVVEALFDDRLGGLRRRVLGFVVVSGLPGVAVALLSVTVSACAWVVQ
jgi:hypothetical protein